MTNKLDQMMHEILNKKFNKKIHSGYDPEDVDAFFDYVNNYLREINTQANNLLASLQNAQKERDALNIAVNEKNKTIERLQNEIDELKAEGYNNQRLSSELSELKKKIGKIEERENK